MKHLFLFLSIVSAIIAVVLFSMTNLQAEEADIKAPSIESENEHPFAEKCYKCHATEPAHQEWLNSGHSKALVNLRDGDEPTRDSCLGCHSSGYSSLANQAWPKEQPFNLETAMNAIACSSCHAHSSKLEHYLVKPAKKLCVTCHKMDCGCAGAGIIHQSQAEMFLGREGAGVRRKPSPHVKAMKKRCVRCHMDKKDPEAVAQHGGHTFIADFSVCADCHDDMDTKFPKYRKEIEAKMKAVKAILDNAIDPSSDAYTDAKKNYDMVKGDGGYGLHNIPYARMLLDYSLSLKAEIAGTAFEEAPAGGE